MRRSERAGTGTLLIDGEPTGDMTTRNMFRVAISCSPLRARVAVRFSGMLHHLPLRANSAKSRLPSTTTRRSTQMRPGVPKWVGRRS
jgi:hypothetical protein